MQSKEFWPLSCVTYKTLNLPQLLEKMENDRET